MTARKEDHKFAQVVQRIDPRNRLLRVWTLEGGVSAQMTALEVLQPDGHISTMVVRQHGARDLTRNPVIARDEFKLLHILHVAGITVPAPYYLDQSGTIFATPYLVVEYIEGKPEFAPADLADTLHQLAAHLLKIHQFNGMEAELSFLPGLVQRYTSTLREQPVRLSEALNERHIRETLKAVWPIPQRNSSVLLHGDYWPGNILWRNNQLVAIIDWEDAMSGDPLADLANSRLEILWAFGSDAMQYFTQQYQAMAPIDFTFLPYWDLAAALRAVAHAGEWTGWVAGEQRMREGHRWFVTQALAKLSAS